MTLILRALQALNEEKALRMHPALSIRCKVHKCAPNRINGSYFCPVCREVVS